MIAYYSALVVLSCLALVVLGVLVYENDRLKKKHKHLLYLIYMLVALSSIAEWAGVWLSGNKAVPVWVLYAVKCADYIMTPVAGGALTLQINSRSIWKKLINIILAFNVIFQIVTALLKINIIIDENNEYSHGPLYFIYVFLYFSLFLCVVIEFVSYGQKFRRHNRVSMYFIMAYIVVGVIIQELSDSGLRTAYIVITCGMAMMYIRNTEFSQIRADDELKDQRLQIMMSQIRPHFLFNSLSVIRETYYSDFEKGDRAILMFSNFLRRNMDALTGEQLVPFTEELEHIISFLELLQLRFGSELDVRFDIAVKSFYLPTLTLQPLVENAVTYGVRKQREHVGVVTIQTREYPDHYEVSVSDNGPGFDPESISEYDSERSHVGIFNVRERLKGVCGGELKIVSAIGKGATVTMILPRETY